MNIDKRFVYAGIVVAIIVVGLVVYFAGKEAGFAAGAAATLASGTALTRTRARDEKTVEDGIKDGEEVIGELDGIVADSEARADDNEDQVADMSGQDQSDLINKLTDGDA